MENVIIVKKNDQERYGCPSDKCYGAYKKFKSLSAHVCRNHPGLKVRRKEKMTAEELKMKSREYRAKYIGKKKLEKKRLKVRRKEKMTAEELKMKSREYRAKYIGKKKLEKKRCTYSIEDAEIRGTHKASEAIVEVKKSSIKGAGRGIFAVEALQKGDIVTTFEGVKTSTEPKCATYCLGLKNGMFLIGSSRLQKGKGIGQFVNRESRKLKKRKNCEIVEVGGNGVLIEITKKVKLGEELLTTYSRGYRFINKK
jgi:hypothetical protein